MDMTASASDEDESLCENLERTASFTFMGKMFAINSAAERNSEVTRSSEGIDSERKTKKSAPKF